MAFRGARCTSKARLDGKCAIITGANSGMGKCTTKDFFERGARVIMACRNEEKGQKAIEDIKNQCGDKTNLGSLLVMPLDLTCLESVRMFAKEIKQQEQCVNLLINNAGIMTCPFSKTADGFEIQFGTNYLGHFLLTLLLLPKLIYSRPTRIVSLSSVAHKMIKPDFKDINWEHKSYSPFKAYQLSKLYVLLFTKELTRQLKKNNIQGVNTYAVHPGLVRTELGRHLDESYFPGFRILIRYTWAWFFKSPEMGAQTAICCAVDEKFGQESGLYYKDCKVAKSSKVSHDEGTAKTLWDMSWKMTKLDSDYNPFVEEN